jgi:hypothetical protein
MTDRGSIVAPYSVRFRITGFLARQHARDGNTSRSLVEFYSMLDVDDPAWTDDAVGDSMRISRDIEVAQMMTEVGFFDHAMRILQTSLILACMNQDPQAPQVEFQMHATAELARLKNAAVPDIDMSFLAGLPPARPGTAKQLVVSDPASPISEVPSAVEESGPALVGEPVEQPPRAAVEEPDAAIASQFVMPQPVPVEEPGPALTQPVMPPAQSASPPNELPLKAEPMLTGEPPSAGGKVEQDKSVGHSRWAWLSPSRWWQKKEIAPVSNLQEEAAPEPPTPTVSPNVAPTYCQECSGLHGSRSGNVVVRYNPRTGITHTHLAGGAPASPMPSPYQRKFAPLKPGGASGCTTCNSEPADCGETASEQAASTPRVSRSSGVPAARASATSGEVPLPPSRKGRVIREVRAKPARTVQQAADQKIANAPQGGPALALPPETEPPAPRELSQPQAAEATPPKEISQPPAGHSPVPQVGIAGEVSNPGIFALRGNSTTLAALLRRTGERDINPDKRARILRSVQLHEGNASEVTKDIYCQRVNSLDAKHGALETPVYGQEVVIVDGSGDRPIYVAVMPHFILQVPVDPTFPVTADQIIEQLRAHWPDVRNQNIGILRYEQWGSANTVSRLEDGDESARAALSAGDVLYVDGIALDRSQVIAAAESIATMAGARIRRHEASTKRSAGSN